MPIGRELREANLQLGKVLKDAETYMLRQYPGVEAETPLVDSTSMRLAIRRGKLVLVKGRMGPKLQLFDIDKAEPHQRVAMANHLGALQIVLRDEVGSLTQEVQQATSKATQFLRRDP